MEARDNGSLGVNSLVSSVCISIVWSRRGVSTLISLQLEGADSPGNVTLGFVSPLVTWG